MRDGGCGRGSALTPILELFAQTSSRPRDPVSQDYLRRFV